MVLGSRNPRKVTLMKQISLEVPEGHLTLLDQLVEEKLFPNRAEAIRNAIRDLLAYHGKI
jgi:Arc/MetJ-type ribon-helix-helix transcriptional regulator